MIILGNWSWLPAWQSKIIWVSDLQRDVSGFVSNLGFDGGSGFAGSSRGLAKWSNDQLGKVLNDLNPPVLTTIASSQYYYDPTGNKLVLFEVPNNVNTYMTAPMLCQYTLQGSVIGQYPVVKQAGLMLLTHFYNNRSAISEAKQYQLPWAIDQLLRPYRTLVM
jgi:hypothetical protein